MARVFTYFSERRPNLAIDFGTANLRLIRRDEGIVFDEPSLCCFEDIDGVPRLVAAGTSARNMVDRTPAKLRVQRPLKRGVLQDIDSATHLLRYAVATATGRKSMRSPSVLIGVPADATQAERGALMTAARDAGLGAATLVSEPFVAAIGANLPIDAPRGMILLECGAGTTEVAVISLGGICQTRSVRIGGNALNRAITDHLHFHHKFLIGALSAEQVKLSYGERTAAVSRGAPPMDDAIQVRGRSLAAQVPSTLSVPLREIERVVDKHVTQIVEMILETLNTTPPELSEDIYTHGVVLTGGSAMTPGLAEAIREGTGLSVTVADEAASCVAFGLHKMLLS